MGLEYVLKGPSDYLQRAKRHRGVTQKNPFSWFEIVGLVLRIFVQPFFHFKTKASSLLLLLEGSLLFRFLL